MELINDLARDKARANNQDFKRFLKACEYDLKKLGYTTCYDMEQVEALGNKFKIEYKKVDTIYYVRLLNGAKKCFGWD